MKTDVRVLAAALAAFMTLATGVHAQQPAQAALPNNGALGVWIDHTGRGGVEIVDCGGKLCGSIVWLREGTNPKGCGIQILANVPVAGPGRWDGGGHIYDPERNDTFDVEVKVTGPDTLKITGYEGIKLFGESFVWKRAPAGLQRCVANAAPAAPAAPAKAR